MKLLHGDNIEILKTLEENSIDAVVTDPPYGLSFMNKKWDHNVPGIELWKNVFRILKPGGHVLSFGGTRTYHRMVVNIEDACFEIRDQIQWIYGSGFPKSHNLKEKWQGWGSALKPANEPIVLARKPLNEKTLAKNILKYGTGALNIDETRVEGIDPANAKRLGKDYTSNKTNFSELVGQVKASQVGGSLSGRWPANVIFDEEAGKMLDEQSGQLKSGQVKPYKNNGGWKNTSEFKTDTFDSSSGGASRFFYCAKASKSERNKGLETSKLNSEIDGAILNQDKSENPNTKGRKANPIDCITQNKKLHRDGNFHPTVKPIKLMEYLCKLITPPNGIILDPFMGSGSTGVAAKNIGFRFVGIELDRDYFEIAKKRIETSKPAICQDMDEDQVEMVL